MRLLNLFPASKIIPKTIEKSTLRKKDTYWEPMPAGKKDCRRKLDSRVLADVFNLTHSVRVMDELSESSELSELSRAVAIGFFFVAFKLFESSSSQFVLAVVIEFTQDRAAVCRLLVHRH